MCRTTAAVGAIDSSAITNIAISSVVPVLDFTLNKMAEVYFGTKPLSSPQKTPACLFFTTIRRSRRGPVSTRLRLSQSTADPHSGRLRNCDDIRCDLKAGEYLGGVIYPGIQVAADACFRGRLVAAIPRSPPPRVIRTIRLRVCNRAILWQRRIVDGCFSEDR